MVKPFCRYYPNHTSPSGKHHQNCRGYSPRRTPYKTPKGTRCCKLGKNARPKTGPKCGTINVRGRGPVSVYKGAQGGVYYLTQTNDKTYIDSKGNIHKKPKACGTGTKRKSPRRKSPRRKSPRRKSPRRKSPRRKSPRRHAKHLHVTPSSLNRKYKKDQVLHKHSTCKAHTV